MSLDQRAILAHIRSAPAGLAEAVAAVPAGQEDRPPSTGEWSARETLIHVRNVIVMAGSGSAGCCASGTRCSRTTTRRPLAARASARREPVETLVRMITAEHEQIVGLLEGLPADRWRREGRHPELGPMSILFLASRVGAHTEEHAGQIRDIARAV